MALGPIMIDLDGPRLTPAERELLRHPNVGGVLLFARNYVDPDQLAALVDDIHGLRHPPLLVAVDHEGGRVQRFRDGFTRLPPVARLGERYQRAPDEAERAAETLGWLLAAELLALGLDLSFAPVLDLGRGISGVIGDRALHRDPEVVAVLGGAIMRGMRGAGMAAVGKHFPGHGSVAGDSHHERPVDERPLADIRQLDVLPFERLVHKGLAAVMTAHVVYSAVDRRPAGFSRIWIEDVLRAELGFPGAVFSDDLAMTAAAGAGGCAARCAAALDAGCDMVPICNDRGGAIEAVEGLAPRDRPATLARLIRLHGHPARGIDRGLARTRGWREARAVVEGLLEPDDPELDFGDAG